MIAYKKNTSTSSFAKALTSFGKFASLAVPSFTSVIFEKASDNIFWGAIFMIGSTCLVDYALAISTGIHALYGVYIKALFVISLLVSVMCIIVLVSPTLISELFSGVAHEITKIAVIFLVFSPLAEGCYRLFV